jgi:hypothetical protein
MTVKEQNAKEIENNSQGMRLARGGPQSPQRWASAQNAGNWSYESERKSGPQNNREVVETD